MTKPFDWCRHCGAEAVLTEEHIPPRSTGNDGEGKLYRQIEGALRAFRDFDDGHSVPTLCGPCNSGASERGLPQAYTRWQSDVLWHVQQAAAAFSAVSGEPPNHLWYVVKDENEPKMLPMEHGKKSGVPLQPGRIARQVLGMILAVQSNRVLLDEYPQVQRAYLSPDAASIAPLSLHIALADAGLGYLTSGAGVVTVDTQTLAATARSEFWMISCPPFLMILSKGSAPPISATRIDGWLRSPAKDTPATEQFSKQGRRVTYPIAHIRETLVGKMYQDQVHLRNV